MSMCAMTFRREMIALCKQAQLRRHRDLVQDAVDAVADAQVVFERLDVNVRRALGDGLADDLVDELHDGRLGIVGVEVRRLTRGRPAVSETLFWISSSKVSAPDAVERLDRADERRPRDEQPLRASSLVSTARRADAPPD